MSCRTTAGGSASTSLARATTRLTDREIQVLFHSLKREGHGAEPPTAQDVETWRHAEEDLLHTTDMSETNKDSIRDRLFKSRGEDPPDAPTFYAWSRIEARARQEVATRNISDVIDLAPPGSQSSDYKLDANGRPTEVWYASYGSNLSRARFLTYLKGGTPQGSIRSYPGCSDTTEPTGDIPLSMSGQMHFALTSRVWGAGGVGFMDTTGGDDQRALGRAYKITAGQFDEVVHFENSGKTADGAAQVDLTAVLAEGHLTTGPGAYQNMVHVGDHQGAPVITFTAPFTANDAVARRGQVAKDDTIMDITTNKPTAPYMQMIGRGLQETFGMTPPAQADYLRGCPGGDQWGRRDLIKALQTPDPSNP